jgi:hypothetical protein
MLIFALFNRKLVIVRSPTNKWVYGLLSIHFILSPFAFDTVDAVNAGIEYGKVVLLYLLMLAVADDEEPLRFMIKAFVFSMMFYALHSLWEYHNGRYVSRMGISRMVGVDSTFSDPNAFGASIVLSLPFVYALLRTEASNWLRRSYYAYFGIAVICIVLTGSRSAFAALIFLSLLWVISQKALRKYKLFAMIVPAVFLLWSAMPEEKQDRIRTLWDPTAGPANAQESAEGRLVGFRISWRMFLREPLTGVGAGGDNYINYRMAHNIHEEGHENPSQAHNLYGQVLAEFGVPGAVLLTGLVLCLFSSCWTVRSALAAHDLKSSFSYLLANSITVAVLLLLFLGLGGHNFYRPLWLWLAAWSGSLFNIHIIRKATHNNDIYTVKKYIQIALTFHSLRIASAISLNVPAARKFCMLAVQIGL